MRDELLDGELFLYIDEVRYVVDRWRMDCNHYRPHSSLDYMAPAASGGTAFLSMFPQRNDLSRLSGCRPKVLAKNVGDLSLGESGKIFRRHVHKLFVVEFEYKRSSVSDAVEGSQDSLGVADTIARKQPFAVGDS